MFLFVIILVTSLYSYGADKIAKSSSNVRALSQALKKSHISKQKQAQESSDDESDEEATDVAVPAQITPRYAQLIFNGYSSMVAIASAINAEQKGLYFSFYEANELIKNNTEYSPIIRSLLRKQDDPIAKQALVDKKNYEKNDIFAAVLMHCKCTVKRSNSKITKHSSQYDHLLHQKIYLFENAYQGEPVCFIGSHNPTDHSISKQHNSMLMITGEELFAQLKDRFDLLFQHHATPVDDIKLTDESIENFEDEKKLPEDVIPQEIDMSKAVKLPPDAEISLLKTPLTQDPGREIIDTIVDLINNEDEELYYVHYRLTDAKIVYALRDAMDRGVNVHIMIDDSGLERDEGYLTHRTGHLAMKKLQEKVVNLPNCSFGVITQKLRLMLHDKTLACKNNGEGVVVIGSWNSTGNSTLYSCEATAVCKGSNELFEQIKTEFDRLKRLKNGNHQAAQAFYQTSESLMSNVSFSQKFTPFSEHKAAAASHSYSINNWKLGPSGKHLTLKNT
jgi:phosphatidylserine/phosphatidylglycerophosphate/cardiolipin synthase-like enzyme